MKNGQEEDNAVIASLPAEKKNKKEIGCQVRNNY